MTRVERFAWRCVFFGLALIDLIDLVEATGSDVLEEWQHAKRSTQ